MRSFLIGLILILFLQITYSQDQQNNIPFYPNETIDYNLKYGIFKVGVARLEFRYDDSCSDAFIYADAKSVGLIKYLKNIHFRYQCCMDTLTGLPITDSRILIEGDFEDINTVYYDHTSRSDSSLVYSVKTDTQAVPKNIYDILSGLYKYRANLPNDNLPQGHVATYKTFFIDEVFDLIVRYKGIETIKTCEGDIECIKIMPVTIIGHFFKTTDAMSIWLTNDSNYIPVKFTIDLRIGKLHGEFTSYRKPELN